MRRQVACLHSSWLFVGLYSEGRRLNGAAFFCYINFTKVWTGETFVYLCRKPTNNTMKPKDWGTTDIRLTKMLSLNVEWTYYAEDVSADRDVPSEPAIYEIETVWLFEEITESIIDVTDLEGTLWQHDEVLQIVEGGKR